MNPMNKFVQDLAVPTLNGVTVGHTGYLDQLKVEDLASPVMKGVDEHGRPFLAMKLQLVIEFDDSASPAIKETQVACFFQRYSDQDRVWTIGIRGESFSPDLVGQGAGHVDPEKIQQLLAGAKLTRTAFGETQKLQLVK